MIEPPKGFNDHAIRFVEASLALRARRGDQVAGFVTTVATIIAMDIGIHVHVQGRDTIPLEAYEHMKRSMLELVVGLAHQNIGNKIHKTDFAEEVETMSKFLTRMTTMDPE